MIRIGQGRDKGQGIPLTVRTITPCTAVIVGEVTDYRTSGIKQQKLFADGGVGAHRCLIGHCCGNADPAYHRRVVDGGSYIGFDRIGILRLMPDETRADNLAKLVRDGFAKQVMMTKRFMAGVALM